MTTSSSVVAAHDRGRAGPFFRLVKQALRKWSDDRAPRLGAALAYYAIFALAPLIVIAVAVAGFVYGDAAARGEIVGQIEGRVGTATAELVEDMIESAGNVGEGVAATIVGVLLTLLGASALFLHIQGSLNVVWDVPLEQTKGLRATLRKRILAFLFVLAAGLLLVALLAASSVSAGLRAVLPDELEFAAPILQFVNPLMTLGLLTLVFALVFRFLPDVRTPWRIVLRGAALTSFLFTIGTFLLGLYLGGGGVGSAFGAAGALVVLLVFLYYSAQIFLFGAEFTRVSMLASQPQPEVGVDMLPAGEPARASAHVTAVWAFLAGMAVGWWRRRE